MRRKDREVLDVNEIVEIVSQCKVCVIGMHDGEDIYLVPLNFGHTYVDNELTLYFHCASEGKKIDLLKVNPRVSFEMDCNHDLQPSGDSYTYKYGCVIGKGVVEFIDDNEKKNDAFQVLLKNYDVSDLPITDAMLTTTTVFKVKVSEFTGKKNK